MATSFTDDGTRAAFLSRMIRATESGKVKWITIDGRPFWFVTDLLPFSYVIHAVDADDQPPYELRIFKYLPDEDPQEGTNNLIEVWGWDRFRLTALNEYLQDLYAAAMRQTKGVGDLAQEMFRALATADGGTPEPERFDLTELPPSDESPF